MRKIERVAVCVVVSVVALSSCGGSSDKVAVEATTTVKAQASTTASTTSTMTTVAPTNPCDGAFAAWQATRKDAEKMATLQSCGSESDWQNSAIRATAGETIDQMCARRMNAPAPICAAADERRSSVPAPASPSGVPAGSAPTGVPNTPAAAVLRTIRGEVEVLDQVWFSDSKGPDPGRGCSGRGDYSDLAPGGLVIVSEPSGVALATASLGAGTLRMKVKGGTDERRRRDELITSIFNLRIARSDAEGNDVKSADLRLQLAKTRLAEAENPNLSTLPFEGNTFQAAYCHFEFSSSGLKGSTDGAVGRVRVRTPSTS